MTLTDNKNLSKSKSIRALLVIFILILIPVSHAYSQEPDKITMPAFKSILDSFNLSGSVLVLDETGKLFYSNDYEWANEGHLPASTFKIPNSIISLETGVMLSDSTVIKWDGKPRRLKAWEKDLTLREAFQVSCVPCYQEIARQIGLKNMRYGLDRLQYPGMVVDSATIDNFWLQGDSKISQFQQIDFLVRFYHSQLPINSRSQSIVKSMMLYESTETYKLYGKTGWGNRDGNNNGWYVGFIESKNKVYFFATNVVPHADFNLENFTSVRIEVTKNALKQLGLM